MSGFHVDEYVPLSVRTGGRRAKFGWWLKGRRQALALKIAPWFNFAAGDMARKAWDLSQRRAVRVLNLERAVKDATTALEVDSEWSADQLLDAIEEARTTLASTRTGPLPEGVEP